MSFIKIIFLISRKKSERKKFLAFKAQLIEFGIWSENMSISIIFSINQRFEYIPVPFGKKLWGNIDFKFDCINHVFSQFLLSVVIWLQNCPKVEFNPVYHKAILFALRSSLWLETTVIISRHPAVLIRQIKYFPSFEAVEF